MPITKKVPTPVSAVVAAHTLGRADNDYLADQVNRLSADIYENNRIAKELIDVGDEQKASVDDLTDRIITLNDLVETLTEAIKALTVAMKNKDTK